MDTLGMLAAIVGGITLAAMVAAAILPDPDAETRRRIEDAAERRRQSARNGGDS